MKHFDLDSIKRNINLIELADQYTNLKHSGKSATGPCPKCQGRDRFVVYSNRFLCRECHPTYGDAIEFARWLNDFSFREAVEWLTNGNPPILVGVNMSRPMTPKPRPLLIPPAAAWQERARAFVEYARTQLWDQSGRVGLDYLLSRGLTETTIIEAGLGYNPQDINDIAARWGITDRDTVWLPGPGIVIPWFIDNALHRVNIRLIKPRGKLKYIGPPGWGGANPLYNADAITANQIVLLMEGELCVLTVTQEAGDLITAAATGAKDSARAGRWIARLAAAPLVLLAFDAEPDKGDAAARRWADLLPNSRRWRPLLKDVNDMHRAGVSVRNWIAAALPTEATESSPDFGSPAAPFEVVDWPADIPALALPRYTRLENGRLRTEYKTEQEFRDNVQMLALLKETAEMGGVLTAVRELT